MGYKRLKMIDADKIFSMFEEPQESGFPGTVYIDFKDHPAYWLGMFEKTILNYQNYCIKLLSFFKLATPALDISEVGEAGEYIVYNRALEHIRDFDITNKSHLETLENRATKRLSDMLQKSIEYFISTEEYEKCAFLKPIQDQVELFLK
jgi:hypothetical protein